MIKITTCPFCKLPLHISLDKKQCKPCDFVISDIWNDILFNIKDDRFRYELFSRSLYINFDNKLMQLPENYFKPDFSDLPEKLNMILAFF